MAGAVFIKKLTTPATQAAQPKKRARAPDLAAEAAPAKKAKAKAKGRAKAKAKTAASPALAQESAADMEADVGYSFPGHGDEPSDALPQGSRQRLWLDDMLAALGRCRTGPFRAESTTPAACALLSVLIACALEFAFMGVVRLQSKVMKEWSKVTGVAQTQSLGSLWCEVRFCCRRARACLFSASPHN